MRTVTNRLGIQALLIDETLPENAHPLYFQQREIPLRYLVIIADRHE